MNRMALLTLLLASLLNSPLARAIDTNPVITAVGQCDIMTSSHSVTSYPLLIQSNDSGLTWSASGMKTNLPDNYYNEGIFNSIYCEDENCLLAGTYRDNRNVNHPLLYKSTDDGNNWLFITALPKDYIGSGKINDVHCDKLVCIAVGQYRDRNGWQPLLAVSYNSGKTWLYPETIIKNLPDKASRPEFTKAYCKNQLCIASGENRLNGGIIPIPLLAQSTDAGMTWNYVTTLPNDFENKYDGGLLHNNVINSNNIFMAVGRYEVKTSNVRDRLIDSPLLLQSSDAGLSWSARNMKADLPRNYHYAGVFYGIYCEDENCFLAGRYRDDKSHGNKDHPLLYKSTDNGNNWISISRLPEDYSGNGIFYDVHCDKLLCIAAGRYENKKERWLPLLAVSHNLGVDWFYPKTIIANLPQIASYPKFTKTYCKDKICIAIGRYDLGINGYNPLLAKSNDSGLTWNYVPTLPDDFGGHGFLSNISVHGGRA